MPEYQNDEIIVSVCLTAYNHGQYIAQALDSVLMQEVDFKYEIVVGEDCSPDNTREILLKYKEKYPDKLKLLLHEKNMGAKKNVITTLKNCSGKYIAMLDGDDYWIDPEKLRIQIALMEENPDCHMSFHPAEARVDMNEYGKTIAKHSDSNKIFTASEIIVGGGGFCPTGSCVFRREAIMDLLDTDLFSNTPVGDYYMQVFGSLHGGAFYINRTMSVYRQGVPTSWRSSMETIDFDKRIQWHRTSINSLKELNEFLNRKYKMEINQRISNQYYRMALSFFVNDMYQEFKRNMEMSYNLFAFKSLTYSTYYYLRFFPKLLKLLKKYNFKG